MSDFEGLDELVADFGYVAGRAAPDASRLLRKGGTDVQRAAQSIAPVDTGAYRSSISVSTLGQLVVEVGPTVDYGPYLEYGTSRMAPFGTMGKAGDVVVPGIAAAFEQLAEQYANRLGS